MSDSSHRLQLLFDKYEHGKCTAGELKDLIALLKKTDTDEVLTEQMKALWQSMKDDKEDYDVDWNKMYVNISSAGGAATEKRPIDRARRMWVAAAAVLILIAGAAGYLFLDNSHPTGDTIVYVPSTHPRHNNTRTIYLPDSSTVILNEGSRLIYPPASNGFNREVDLVGEAYFDIKHNARKAFLVHTGKLTIKVLGTAFNIKAYPDEPTIEVTVSRGKVQVLNNKKSIGLLSANQQMVFDKKMAKTTQYLVDADTMMFWKSPEIMFDDITMQEAAQRMETRFNVSISFENEALKNCRVSATFSEDDLMEEMLSVICGVSKASYTIENNKIIIHGKGCN